MKHLQPMFAAESTMAKLLDMNADQLCPLVEAGHLPRPRNLGGLKRWDVEELRRIARGDAAAGMRNVDW